jgi:holo-[acyl-carrier protein] synthase
MVVVGTDIVQISRIAEAAERFGDRFVRRYLSEEEYSDIKKHSSLAGYWAAKEAVAKALGCGIGKQLSFHDIRLSKNSHGAPLFSLTAKAASDFPILQSSLSISHDGGFAIAVAVIVIDNPEPSI